MATKANYIIGSGEKVVERTVRDVSDRLYTVLVSLTLYQKAMWDMQTSYFAYIECEVLDRGSASVIRLEDSLKESSMPVDVIYLTLYAFLKDVFGSMSGKGIVVDYDTEEEVIYDVLQAFERIFENEF